MSRERRRVLGPQQVAGGMEAMSSGTAPWWAAVPMDSAAALFGPPVRTIANCGNMIDLLLNANECVDNGRYRTDPGDWLNVYELSRMDQSTAPVATNYPEGCHLTA